MSTENNTQYEKWQCKVFDLSVVDKKNERTLSKVYDLWDEVYAPILKQSGETLRSDYFFRCKSAVTLLDAFENPLAFVLHNHFYFGINGSNIHSYFDISPQDYKDLHSKEQSIITTFEWVTIHPSFSRKKEEIRPAHVIMGLSMLAVQQSHSTGFMGYSRTDFKADKNAEIFGFRPLEDLYRHDIHCKLMYASQADIKSHYNPTVVDLTNKIWSSAQNYSPFFSQTDPLEKRRYA